MAAGILQRNNNTILTAPPFAYLHVYVLQYYWRYRDGFYVLGVHLTLCLFAITLFDIWMIISNNNMRNKNIIFSV